MTKHRWRVLEVPEWAVDIASQAPGAWPNGSLVRKARVESGDFHGVGATGTVIGSVGPLRAAAGVPAEYIGHYGYFVIWDDLPGVTGFVYDDKLGLAVRGG